jgi:phosphatidate cytidylyltransferase
VLLKRFITSVIFGSLVIVSIFWLPIIIFKILVGLIISLAAWEFSELFWHKEPKKRACFLGIYFLVVIFGWFLKAAILIIVIGALWWLISPVFLLMYLKNKKAFLNNIVFQYVTGIMSFVPCFFGLIYIREAGMDGAKILFYLILIVCATDVGGYFVGRFFGKHLLAPSISPKKTVEGAIGGIILALIVAIISGHILKINYGYGYMFNLATIIACGWPIFGDLFESMLKRQVGVKDSGKLLPGHGGMYDRIDGLIAAVPIFYSVLILLY